MDCRIANPYVGLGKDFSCQSPPISSAVPVSTSGLPVLSTGGIPKPGGGQGNLSVLDWAGFKGAVSCSFDDVNSSQISNYNKINSCGVPMTFYLTTGKREAMNSIWAQALKDGHELGNHTVSHPSKVSANELDEATKFIEKQFGITPLTMTAPYGDMSYVDFASSRFLLNRGVWGGSTGPNDSTDPCNLQCKIPSHNAPVSEMNKLIDTSRSAGKWQIICLHGHWN